MTLGAANVRVDGNPCHNSSMKIDVGLVSRVAKLAALDVTPAEAEALAGQLTHIVEHFEALRAISDDLLTEPASQAPTPLRQDVARDRSPGDLLVKNAPEFAHGHFVVPRVVSRDG